MKKSVRIFIAVVLAVWVFAMGYEIGAYHETKSAKTTEAVSTSAANALSPVTVTSTTAAPSSTYVAPTAQQAAPSSTAASTAATSAQSTTAPTGGASTLSNAELLTNVTNAVNGTKHYSGTFTVTGKQVKDLNITDCSVKSMTNTINKTVKNFVGGGKDFNHTFTNGVSSSDSAVTPTSLIPPRDKDFALTEQGISSITSAAEGENTVYTVALNPEKANLTTLPANNSVASGYLDLSSLSILDSVDYDYPGTTITYTVNPQGMLSALHLNMPMAATGKGKIFTYEGSATFEGSLDENWTFTYA